jgi:hypothetical protein
LPLGLGYVTDVALDLGLSASISPPGLDFSLGLGSEQHPFHWVVSPLSGTGAMTLGVTDGKAALMIEAGVGAGVAIDVAVASGSASIVLGFAVELRGADVTLKVILTGQATVDVLDGFASASLSLTSTLGVEPKPALSEATFEGQVAVGIHVTVAWVGGFDWDGAWGFSQTYELNA